MSALSGPGDALEHGGEPSRNASPENSFAGVEAEAVAALHRPHDPVEVEAIEQPQAPVVTGGSSAARTRAASEG